MHIAKKIGEKMSELKKLALMGGTPSVNEKFPKWPQITDEDVREVVSTLQTYNLSAYEVIDGPLFDFELEFQLSLFLERLPFFYIQEPQLNLLM